MKQHSKSVNFATTRKTNLRATLELAADKPPRHPANCTLGLGSSSALMHGGFDRCMAALWVACMCPQLFGEREH